MDGSMFDFFPPVHPALGGIALVCDTLLHYTMEHYLLTVNQQTY